MARKVSKHSRKHNHIRKLAWMRAQGRLPDGVHGVEVSHDDWCGVWTERYCNCDPDVRVRWSQPAGARN
jgi:hypothetical protein